MHVFYFPKLHIKSLLSYLVQVLGLEKANSNEFDDETPDPVVIFMPEVYISSFSFYFFILLPHACSTRLCYILCVRAPEHIWEAQ